MMPRMQHFLSAHPEVDVRLLASGRLMSATAQQLLTEEVGESPPEPDIEIQFSNGRPEGDVVDLLLTVEVVPMCQTRLIKTGPHPLRAPEDLRHHTLLHGDTGIADRARSAWARWLQHAGVSGVDFRRGLQFDHSTLALDAAADGLGVTLATPLLAMTELERRDVAVAFPQALTLDKAYYAVTSPSAISRPEVAEFREWLLREAALSKEQTAALAKKNGRGKAAMK
jgi:LysR family glycine cleavage system transcriptional activator